MLRTMARQRARSHWLREGDACTKFFHLQACHRRRKNYMFAIVHEGNTFTEEQAKAGIVFNYYNDIIGKPFRRLHRIDLGRLDLPTLDLDHLAAPFTAAEVARIVHETSSDRAPGPDGFSGAFYKKAWEVVGPDVVRMFGRYGTWTFEASIMSMRRSWSSCTRTSNRRGSRTTGP